MGLDLLPESTSPSLSSSTHSASNPFFKSNLHPQIQSLKQALHSQKLFHGRATGSRNFLDNDSIVTRSLPETPRISSARRSDVDHHRFSLQLNRENSAVSQEFECSNYSARKSTRRRDSRLEDHENRRPGHYARQIGKQVKENVSSKFGLDLTNTIKNREQGREDHVVLLKSKKPSISLSLLPMEYFVLFGHLGIRFLGILVHCSNELFGLMCEFFWVF